MFVNDNLRQRSVVSFILHLAAPVLLSVFAGCMYPGKNSGLGAAAVRASGACRLL